jgi:hypothetical protein
MADTPCLICLAPLQGEESQALMCGHVLHTVCLQRYKESKGWGLEDVKCPSCKLDAHQVAQMPTPLGFAEPGVPNEMPSDANPSSSSGDRPALLPRAVDDCELTSQHAILETVGQEAPRRVRITRRPRAFRLPTSQGGIRELPAPRPRRRAVPGSRSRSPTTVPDGQVDPSHPGQLPEPIVGSPSSQTELSQAPEPLPTYRHARRKLVFTSALEKRRRLHETANEPVADMLTKIRACHDAEAFADALYCDAMFKGLSNPDEVTSTVKEWLVSIVRDERTHYLIAADVDHDSRLLSPLPWQAAMFRVSQVQGYHPEVFSLLLDSNLSFMEHVETSLTHDTAVQHRVSPPQACCLNMPASNRKTDLEGYATSLLLGAAGAPASWTNREVLMSDGTKKGTENLLLNFREGLLSSSEGANTIFVPGYSDAASGIHFFSKQRLCQWTQSEGISTSTGQGQCILHPNSYKFGCRILAQDEVGEGILTPTAQGLHKRFAFGCVPEGWMPDESFSMYPCAQSKAAIQNIHSFLIKQALPHKSTISLDGFALAVYDAIAAGVTEFLQSPDGRRCNKWLRPKLLFFRSDLLRQASIVMRIAQGLTDEKPPEGECQILRGAIRVEEILCALHRVRRQWHLHHALYRNLQATQAAPDASGPGALRRPDRGEGGADVEPLLSHAQVLEMAVLTTPLPDEVFTLSALRTKFRNKRHPAFKANGGRTLALKLSDAIQALKDRGLLMQVDAPSDARNTLQWSVSQEFLAKTSADSHSEDALEYRRAAGVSVEHFPAQAN